MRIVNHSSHPTAQVNSVVRAGWYGRQRHVVRDAWSRRPLIVVHRRARRSDDREGFTPFDRSRHIDLWIEDSDRYPQAGNATSWQQELLMSAAHERYHYDHPDVACPNNRCERAAEARARAARARFAHI